MDLDRMKQVDREALCRKYFFLGFAGLPFLWAINVVWFGNLVFCKCKSPSTENGTNHQSEVTNGQNGDQVRQRNVASNQPTDPILQADSELETRDSMKRIRNYVIFSFIGTTLWVVGIIVWVVIFQNNRASWGEFGDSISYHIPRGIA